MLKANENKRVLIWRRFRIHEWHIDTLHCMCDKVKPNNRALSIKSSHCTRPVTLPNV